MIEGYVTMITSVTIAQLKQMSVSAKNTHNYTHTHTHTLVSINNNNSTLLYRLLLRFLYYVCHVIL